MKRLEKFEVNELSVKNQKNLQGGWFFWWTEHNFVLRYEARKLQGLNDNPAFSHYL